MKKFKNHLGSGYDDADKDLKLLFRAALIQASKRDGIDYMQRFQQTWQYVEATGSIPTAITEAYNEHIADVQTLDSSKLATLKMA